MFFTQDELVAIVIVLLTVWYYDIHYDHVPLVSNKEKNILFRYQLEEDDRVLQRVTGLQRRVFNALVAWIQENTPPPDSKARSQSLQLDEQLAIVLHICRFGASYQNTCNVFGRSKAAVSHAFHRIIPALVVLHYQTVKHPDPTVTPVEISSESRFRGYFDDCIGAFDGTLIPAHVPYLEQSPWRSRKGTPAQNVFAACSFNMMFTAIHAGWEGSANDVAVLKDALIKDRFRPVPGKYYLADAGYYSNDFMLVPYEKTRYHLREWKLFGGTPETKEELFNLRHASLRNVIERSFGVLKRKWQILKKPPEYSIGTQVNLVLVCTALHNFIKLSGCDDDEEFCFTEADEIRAAEVRLTEEGEAAPYVRISTTAAQKARIAKWEKRRDDIAQKMWDDYMSRRRVLEG